jgi:hypothetical protein
MAKALGILASPDRGFCSATIDVFSKKLCNKQIKRIL